MTPDRDNALGIYISIPFCRSKCTYCNFASGVYPASDHERYVDRLIHDLVAAERWALEMGVELPRIVDTVYLGGGTPSLLAAELLARMFDAMRSAFDFDSGLNLIAGVKWRGFAVGLLVRNAERGDYGIIEAALREDIDPFIYHSIGIDVRHFVEAHRSEGEIGRAS